MNKNVFVFWIGDKKKIDPFIKKLKDQNLNVILGPTKSEHEYLTSNFDYYKNSFNEGIYSFCSDVWRFYKLANGDGLYIDADEWVGPEFYKYFDDFKKYDIVALKENSNNIMSSFIYSNGKNKEPFKKALEIYKQFNSQYPRVHPIGPHVATYIFREFHKPGFVPKVNNGIYISNALVARDKKRYIKSGHASWSGGYNPDKYWRGVEQNFISKKRFANKSESKYYNVEIMPLISYLGLRDEYDKTLSKSQLKELVQIYKGAHSKKFFSERLIWSKLFRFFTFKFIKSK